MSFKDAQEAFDDVRSSTAVYDDARLREFYATIKNFLAKAAEYNASVGSRGGTPFVDTTRELVDDLPEPQRSEADAWIEIQVQKKRWSRTAAMTFRYYLKFKLVEDVLDPRRRALLAIYDPLVELLKSGCGYIHDHHGAVILGGRGMILYEPPVGKG